MLPADPQCILLQTGTKSSETCSDAQYLQSSWVNIRWILRKGEFDIQVLFTGIIE